MASNVTEAHQAKRRLSWLTHVDTLTDLALSATKSGGREEVRFFAPQMAAQTRRRWQIEQALR